jgi:hypothetical protein
MQNFISKLGVLKKFKEILKKNIALSKIIPILAQF